MSDQRASAEVGSLAEEAAKLLGALTGWAEEHLPDLEQAGGHAASVAAESHEHVAGGGPECTWCPVCRVLRALRDTSPEVRTHLSAAAGSLLQALSVALTTEPEAPSRGARVERIHLDDEWPDGDPEGDVP